MEDEVSGGGVENINIGKIHPATRRDMMADWEPGARVLPSERALPYPFTHRYFENTIMCKIFSAVFRLHTAQFLLVSIHPLVQHCSLFGQENEVPPFLSELHY
jgi:hypothetical protein